jgi:hypothetical protein
MTHDNKSRFFAHVEHGYNGDIVEYFRSVPEEQARREAASFLIELQIPYDDLMEVFFGYAKIKINHQTQIDAAGFAAGMHATYDELFQYLMAQHILRGDNPLDTGKRLREDFQHWRDNNQKRQEHE